jgi:hypothetical protein
VAAGQWAWPQGSGRGRRAVGAPGRPRPQGHFLSTAPLSQEGGQRTRVGYTRRTRGVLGTLPPSPPCPLLAWLYIADGKELWVGGEMGDKPVFSWATLCTLSERRCLSFNSPENTTLANGELHIFFSFTVTKVVVICCFYSFAHM